MSTALQLALPLESPLDLVRRLRQLGLPVHLGVKLHGNRRVMVTFHPVRGLGVHRGYAYAPDDVLAAIVRWARPRQPSRVRREAARLLLGFPVHDYVSPTPARVRSEVPLLGDESRMARLQTLHLELNARLFDGALRPIPIRLSSRMRRKLGHYEPSREGKPAIVISRRHLLRDGWPAVEQTLLHEMVHQWQDERGLPVDHGPGFRRQARAIGIDPRATSRPQ